MQGSNLRCYFAAKIQYFPALFNFERQAFVETDALSGIRG